MPCCSMTVPDFSGDSPAIRVSASGRLGLSLGVRSGQRRRSPGIAPFRSSWTMRPRRSGRPGPPGSLVRRYYIGSWFA